MSASPPTALRMSVEAPVIKSKAKALAGFAVFLVLMAVVILVGAAQSHRELVQSGQHTCGKR